MSDDLYEERNLCALAFARSMGRLGFTVGWLIDTNEPDWPVLMVDTPWGQVSWHMPATMRELAPYADYPGKWDGHSTPEKYDRLRRLIVR